MSNQRHGVVLARLSARLDHGPSTSRRSSGSSLSSSACSPFCCGGRGAGTSSRSRTIAEQLAVATAGEMMARSQENGDRFSLKEGNSIATLITEAVLALNGEDTRQARRAVRRLKSGNSAPATEIFAELARTKAAEAERAARQAAAALRHQGALTLPKDPHQALDLFQRAFEVDPGQPGKSPRARPRPVQARRYPEHGGLDGKGARRRRGGGPRGHRRHDRHVRRRPASPARAPQGSEREVRDGRPHLRSAGRPQVAGRCHDGAGQHANEGGPAR